MRLIFYYREVTQPSLSAPTEQKVNVSERLDEKFYASET